MLEFDVSADLSYSGIADIYEGILNKSQILRETNYKKGQEIEKRVVDWIKTGQIPEFVQEVFRGKKTHGKSDRERVRLPIVRSDDQEVIVTVGFNARTDFVFDYNGRISIVDTKAGGVYPMYLVQALIIRQIYHERYGIDPDYYLLIKDATQLHSLNMNDEKIQAAFNLFCVGCMAHSNILLRKKDDFSGGLFGESDTVSWVEVLGPDIDPMKLTINSFNLLSYMFNPVLVSQSE